VNLDLILLRFIFAAICLFIRPLATKAVTSRSRGVSDLLATAQIRDRAVCFAPFFVLAKGACHSVQHVRAKRKVAVLSENSDAARLSRYVLKQFDAQT
jgi:hypothetical protein